jgi:TIR domain-containing protein
MKVFVSYAHAQKDWVWERLEPCLRAGGAEVLIDHRQFVAGPAVVGQMDATQDQADRHLLVLSAAYLQSRMCQHEMKRAVQLDPGFARQLVVPIRRDDTPLPASIKRPNALYVDLRDDSQAAPWDLLLKACGADLGTAVPAWLAARDRVLDLLRQDKSLNLVTRGSVRWRGLIDDILARPELKLARLDLEHPGTVSRRGLVASIIGAFGSTERVPDPPEDLPHLAHVLETFDRSRLILQHFDLVPFRPDYDVNLFAGLRHLMASRQLVLLIQSRAPFGSLLPPSHPLSTIDLMTVEL